MTPGNYVEFGRRGRVSVVAASYNVQLVTRPGPAAAIATADFRQ